MHQLLRFPGAIKRDPAVDAWLKGHRDELGDMAHHWFEVIRQCGDDVRELIHDGAPTACVTDAAFAYVNAYKDHVNVGFFRGAEIDDPNSLLQGTGKYMRHVKLGAAYTVDEAALTKLIQNAYLEMKQHFRVEG